jgi:hypothetical protein
MSGLPVSAYPVSGYPVSGYPGPGYPGSAYPMSGVPASGLPGYPGYPPPYGFPPPPAPKKRRTGLWIGLGAGLVVLLLMCGGIGTVFVVRANRVDRAVPVATTGTRAQPTGTPADTHFTGPLPSLLLPVPAGAKALHDFGNADGTLSSSQAGAAYKDVDKATADFDSFGYQRGAVVSWDDHGRIVFIELYQFASDTQASGWLTYHRSASDTVLPGVPDSRVRSLVPDADGWGETVIAAYRHDIVLNMWTNTKGTDDVASAEAIAARQFARLP